MSKAPTALWKVLGTGFGIAVTLGGSIGTGILRKPGIIFAELQAPWYILGLWLLVALYAFLGVLCTLELSLSLPKAGSWYVYAQRAFGPFIGFLVGISSWMGTVTALAFGSYTFAEYLGMLWPLAQDWTAAFAALLLLFLWGLQQLGVVLAGQSQAWLSGIKALALLLFVMACFYYGDGGALWNANPLPARELAWTGSLTALLSIFYAFDGWHTASYFTEENKSPEKSLPKAMRLGVIMVAALYLLVNAAIFYALPGEVLGNSKLAAADAMRLVFGEATAGGITLFLMFSILGILNTQIMFAPRVLYSMSRDGLFFAKAQHINALGSPSVATHATVLASLFFLCLGKTVQERLSDIATFFFVASYLAGFASLLQLRRKEPNLHRPYLSPFYPWLPRALLIFSALFLGLTMAQSWTNAALALGFVGLCRWVFLWFYKVSKT